MVKSEPMRGVIRRWARNAFIYRERIERIDCDGDGNALALISKSSENYQILDGYEGLKIALHRDKPKA